MWHKLISISRKNISLILLLLIVIVPLATLSYLLLYDNYTNRYSEEANKNLQITQVLAQNMDEFVARIKHTLEGIGGLQEFKDQNPQAIKQTFASLALAERDVSLFWITDHKGDLVAKWPDTAPDNSAAGKEFFLRAMQGTAIVSDDLVGEMSSEEIVMVAVPYTGNSGKIAGILGASIPLKQLQHKLVLNIGSTGYPFMVSKSGKVLAHPQLQQLRLKSKDDDPVWLALSSGKSDTIDLVSPFDGQRKLYSYVPLREADWVVAVVQPFNQLNPKLQNLFTRYGAVIGILFLLVVMASRQLVISRNREEEARVLQAEKLAAVGQLAAGIAHEIRNPLTTIKGFVQLIAMREGKFQPEYLDLILKEIESIQGIVEGTLVLAKPHPEALINVNLGNVVQEVCTLMQPQTTLQNINLSLSCPADLPEIKAQPNLLKMVFVNLIKNSIEAMPADGGEISLELKQRGDNIQVTIRDTGKGIPPELIKNLGSPFVTTKENGTGLGLMVTYRIIQNHGGSIRVTSTPGRGTIFVITLPA